MRVVSIKSWLFGTAASRFIAALLLSLFVGAGTLLFLAWPNLTRPVDSGLIEGPCVCKYVNLPSCIYREFHDDYGGRLRSKSDEILKRTCEAPQLLWEYERSLYLGLVGAIAAVSVLVLFGRYLRKKEKS